MSVGPPPAWPKVATLRRIETGDLEQVARFAYSVSITEPLTDLARLREVHAATGLWTADSGALAIVDVDSARLLGTTQFYRSSPTIHGIELGYLIHDRADRGRGLASPAVRAFSDLLFAEGPGWYRQQLLIEVWNTPSWKLAERCGFVREGVLRSGGLGDGDPADCFVYSRTRKDWREEQLTHVGG